MNREELVQRMDTATLGVFDVASTYLGVKLGLYRSLSEDGPATSAELAVRTGTNERLVREWLEQQGATELLDATNEGGEWRFALPAGHAAVLLDPDALDGVAGTVRSLVADLAQVPRLVESFCTGVGIPYAEYGPDGVADRVRFELRDAATLAGAGYDLATLFEMLHDLARPVDVLRAAREALNPDGVVLVADERCGDAFAGPADEQERRHYGYSVLHCLPASMTEPGSAATGTVIRPDIVRRYARDAGFSAVEVLPVESVAFRLYLLRP